MERIKYSEVPSELFSNLRHIEDYLNESSLSLNLLELIRLRVSQKNGCAYCVDMHHKELQHLGETELRLSLLCVWEETSVFTEKERAALHYADVLTRLKRGPIEDADYQPLTTHFSKEEICLLSLTITQINTWNRLMKAFQFETGHYQVQAR